MNLKDRLPREKAFIVVYEEDLSSTPLGIVEVKDDVVEALMKAWLAVVMGKRGDKCVAVVVSHGQIVSEQEIEPRFVYPDANSILRKDPRLAKEVCK